MKIRSLGRALKRGQIEALFNPMTNSPEFYRRSKRGSWIKFNVRAGDTQSSMRYDKHQLEKLSDKYDDLIGEIMAKGKEAQS